MSRIDEIEALLATLQSELAELRAQSATAAERAAPAIGAEVPPEEAFNRRKLLGRMAAVAAAGVGLAAAETLVHPELAAADANTAAVFGNGGTAKDGVEGVTNSSTRSGVYGHNAGLGAGVYAASAGVGLHAHTTATGVPAVEAVGPAFGFGITARTGDGASSATANYGALTNINGTAVLGSVQGGDPSAQPAGVMGLGTDATGVYGGSATGFGVGAYSRDNTALHAKSDESIAIVAEGPIPLRLVPSFSIGAPGSGNHAAGEVYVDAVGDVFVCTAVRPAGGATWKQVQYGGGGGSGGGLQVLTTPGRLMDSRGNGAPITHSSQKLAKGETFGLQVTGKVGVPAGATAVTGSIAVTQPEGAGYLRLFPAQLASSTTSVINFAPGQTVANAFTAALSPTGQLKVQAVDAKTHVIIDITGYVT